MIKAPRKLLLRAALAVALLLVFAFSAIQVFSTDLSSTESFAYFRDEVSPILERTCSATGPDGAALCHGRPPSEVSQLVEVYGPRFQHIFPTKMAGSCNKCHKNTGMLRYSFPIGPSGEFESERQEILAYQKTLPYARHDGAARFAKLLRMPLASQAGGFGLLHGGGEIFESAADPDFKKLAEWVALENLGREAVEEPTTLTAVDVYFRDEVLPVFARNSCLASSCHTFNHSSFAPDPGTPTTDLATPLTERFSDEQVKFNRMTAKGLIQGIVYLTGDVEESRMLKKNIPIAKGGVLHRGGNDQFFTGPEDPDYQAVKGWLELERAEAASKLRSAGAPVPEAELGRVRGLVFVRTRTDTPRRYLDIGKYLPGGDLWVQKLLPGETLETATSEPYNLTARFHEGEQADVREPDVRYDGRGILFAMRVGEEDSLNLYALELDGDLDYVDKSFRRLTWGPSEVAGMRVHYTDPTWVPDPLDEGAAGGGYNLERADVVFVSNLAGEVSRSSERGTVGEADGGTRSTIIDYDRPEQSGSLVGRRVYVVDGTNAGEWRTISNYANRLFTDQLCSTLTVDRPFPEPVDTSTIYVIEKTAEEQPDYLPSYSVYGMKLAEPGREQELYEATVTRVTWTPGHDLDLSVRTTGEVFYASLRDACDKYGRPIFHVASCRRHLDTRFSFPTHQGNRSQVLIYADNHELPTGIDIHVGMDPDNLWEGGNLSVSDHQFGPGLEARNPHDYTTGLFDDEGSPHSFGQQHSNTRFDFEDESPAHPRFVFKKLALFPLRGPDAVTRTGYSPGGSYRDPVPLPDGGLLVSHSPFALNHLSPTANPDYDLWVVRGEPSFHSEGGKTVPAVSKVRLGRASAPGLSDVQAQAIYVRLKPKINAGRRPRAEHLIRYPDQAADERPAKYLERNYLLIDAIQRDPSPVGKRVTYARDPVTGEELESFEQVRYVRMVEALPFTPAQVEGIERGDTANRDPQSTHVSNGIHPQKRIVGEVPLEADGSVYFQVPSRTPLIIQSLNADRMALRQEARHYYFAPNEKFTISPSPSETFQTCGACMGAMSGRPEQLFGPPNSFAGQVSVHAIAKAGGSPPGMGLEVSERLTLDYVRDVQPLLDRLCVKCHSGEEPAADLALDGVRTRHYTRSYESLLQLEEPGSAWYGKKKYVSERDALAIESYLIEKLYGKELAAPRALEGDYPHPSATLLRKQGVAGQPLTAEEKLVLVRWIDLGATFQGAPVPEQGSAEESLPPLFK